MADNYEFISAKDLPTTDAKEVDVLCVEGGELKRKPGASIGGGGGYVVRLPADTAFEGEGTVMNAMVEESYDNFADILYNGGSVQIDMSACEMFRGMFVRLIPNMWGHAEGAFTCVGTVEDTPFVFVFPNGTWTPPTE